MAYKKSYNNKKPKTNYGCKRGKSKYTYTEKVAFNLGTQARIRDSISKDKNTRVYDSYKRGLFGPDKFDRTKKPLI